MARQNPKARRASIPRGQVLLNRLAEELKQINEAARKAQSAVRQAKKANIEFRHDLRSLLGAPESGQISFRALDYDKLVKEFGPVGSDETEKAGARPSHKQASHSVSRNKGKPTMAKQATAPREWTDAQALLAARRGEEIYQNLSAEIVEYNDGDFIAINVRSGKFVVGISRRDAIVKFDEKFTGQHCYIRKIGERGYDGSVKV